MIQIDMPMPKCCGECPFADTTFHNGIISLYCITPTDRSMYAPDLIHRKDRPEWCPLKEQPELVRCEDCKHGEPSCNGDVVFCTKDIGTIDSSIHKPDWFCGDGERR